MHIFQMEIWMRIQFKEFLKFQQNSKFSSWKFHFQTIFPDLADQCCHYAALRLIWSSFYFMDFKLRIKLKIRTRLVWKKIQLTDGIRLTNKFNSSWKSLSARWNLSLLKFNINSCLQWRPAASRPAILNLLVYSNLDKLC